jgi:hypothetical protein
VEWNSRKNLLQGQEMEVDQPRRDKEMGNSDDIYENMGLEPMDID